MDKLLTVVVPVYNTEKYLDKCLSSLVVPNYMDQLEVIVVIDGSPDNSINIARKYKEKYPNSFIVIDKENGGHGSCCNVGLKEATGKYIRFLDSDDWFDEVGFPSFLNKLSTLEDVDIVQTNFSKFFSETHREIPSNLFHQYVGLILNANEFDYGNFDYFVTLATTTFSRKCLLNAKIQFTENAQFDDTILYIQPLCYADKLCFMDEVVYHYLIGRINQSVGRITDRKLQFRRYEFQKLCNEYLKIRDLISNQKRIYADRFIQNIVLEEYYFYSFNVPRQSRNLKIWHTYVKSLSFIDIKLMKYGFLYEKYPYLLLYALFGLRRYFIELIQNVVKK